MHFCLVFAVLFICSGHGFKRLFLYSVQLFVGQKVTVAFGWMVSTFGMQMGGWKRSCCCFGAAPGCGCGCRNLYDGLYGSCCCCPGICLGGTWWMPFARGICPSPETCIPEVLICCSCCIGCQRGRICCMKNTGWPGWKGRVMKAYWAKQNSIGLS